MPVVTDRIIGVIEVDASLDNLADVLGFQGRSPLLSIHNRFQTAVAPQVVRANVNRLQAELESAAVQVRSRISRLTIKPR